MTASAARTVPSAVAEKLTPRFLSSPRSFSKARATHFCAASSLLPNASPTARKSFCSKKRSRIAVRSRAPNWLIASSRIGATCARFASEWSSSAFISRACLSRDSRRRSVRITVAATKQVCRCSQPPSITSLERVRAMRARSANTVCATSSARCESPLTDRIAEQSAKFG